MTALPIQVSVDVDRDLEDAIRFAGSEDQLEAALERVQAGFEAGNLSQEGAERLAALAADTARQLARGLVNIPASAFLEAQE